MKAKYTTQCTICLHHNRLVIDQALSDPRANLSALRKQHGVSWQALQRHRTKHLPQVLTRVATVARAGQEVVSAAQLVSDVEVELVRYAIAHKTQRVARLQLRFEQLDQIVRERGEAYRRERARLAEELRELEARGEKGDRQMPPEVPGAGTGLLVRTLKTVASCAVEEWKLDVGLIEEERALAKQAAEELGQLAAASGSHTTLNGGVVIMVPPSDRPDEPLPVLEVAPHVQKFLSQRTQAPPAEDDGPF